MPIYGHGLVYGSPTSYSKDAYVYPDSGRYPLFNTDPFGGFGQANGATTAASSSGIGKAVAVVAVLGSLTIFGLTLLLGKKGK